MKEKIEIPFHAGRKKAQERTHQGDGEDTSTLPGGETKKFTVRPKSSEAVQKKRAKRGRDLTQKEMEKSNGKQAEHPYGHEPPIPSWTNMFRSPDTEVFELPPTSRLGRKG